MRAAWYALQAIVLLSSPVQASGHPAYRYLPGDPEWPTDTDWRLLNQTVGGRLIRGVPLSQLEGCINSRDSAACASLADEWHSVDPFVDDPVNVMSPYWLNNSCSPFSGSGSTCRLGNLASYAIDIADADAAVAGIRFAQQRNIRLIIKNTGHDYLGRSAGAGSLALANYTGPAVKVGAGVQVAELFRAAQRRGLRVVGGSCPTVGVAGGWLSGGGHGALSSAYGLGADQALEYEVVTATGQHLIASPRSHASLYWALSGGGPGNYAVILSVTIKAHRDGPVAGLSLTFTNTNPDTYWRAIVAWIRHLVDMDASHPTLNTATTFTELQSLNVTTRSLESRVSPTFYDHYQHFTTSPLVNATNLTVGGRLIPRSLAQSPTRLATLIETVQSITDSDPTAVFVIVSNNLTHENAGNNPGSNAVHPAWRESLFLLTFGLPLQPQAPWDVLQSHQAEVNRWIDIFRSQTPGGGSYMNEATFDNSQWKQDYYGANYERLATIKAQYDPDYLLFANAAVASDVMWQIAADGSGRLYRR
ncbi:hypothetical protein BDV10DRAFT_189141 [Aspergillus recurvatus]